MDSAGLPLDSCRESQSKAGGSCPASSVTQQSAIPLCSLPSAFTQPSQPIHIKETVTVECWWTCSPVPVRAFGISYDWSEVLPWPGTQSTAGCILHSFASPCTSPSCSGVHKGPAPPCLLYLRHSSLEHIPTHASWGAQPSFIQALADSYFHVF